MKKKIIIVSASIVGLALIVALGITAQSSKNSKNLVTEQTDENVPESCKKCPSASTCLEGTSQTTETASACNSKSDDEISTGESTKCDSTKSCSKSTTCVEKKCTHEKASCEKQCEAKTCTRSTECKKTCEKK